MRCNIGARKPFLGGPTTSILTYLGSAANRPHYSYQITIHRVPELIEKVLLPASLDAMTQIADDLKEMTAQLNEQVNRLGELRTMKQEHLGMKSH